MDIIQTILTLIFGAGISVLTTYLNNKYSLERDKFKFDKERELERDKQELEKNKETQLTLITSSESALSLIYEFEHSIGLTSSVIDSSANMSYLEFDSKYKQELNIFVKLKALVAIRFPDFYDNITKLDGLHNQYWGYQRLLLIDKNQNGKNLLSLTKEIRRIETEANQEIRNVVNELLTYTKRLSN
jgi:hypothetical protein